MNLTPGDAITDSWPNKKYQIIYADPPWCYQDKLGSESAKMGACEYHYPTMNMPDLCKMPVQQLADKDTVLFLWVTMPKLNEVFDLISAWGFVYKTVAFVWVKLNPKTKGVFQGIGRWVQGNAELVLLATKGKPKRMRKDISQIVMAERGRHSRKPPEIRNRIIELMGDLPRIELFARKENMLFDAESYDGWDVWGNEV